MFHICFQQLNPTIVNTKWIKMGYGVMQLTSLETMENESRYDCLFNTDVLVILVSKWCQNVLGHPGFSSFQQVPSLIGSS
jgi:hypothetical protein